jgi:hypothetical protein
MGNTVPEKESIEHCSYTVMFQRLSGFKGTSSPPDERLTEYTRLQKLLIES